MKKILSNKSIQINAQSDPIADVNPNESFTVETINAYGNRFSNLADLLKLISDKSGNNHHHPMTGPIYINGSKKGDVLRVELESIVPYEMAQLLSRSAGIDPLKSTVFGDRAPVVAELVKERGKIKGIHYQESIILPYSPMVGIIGTAPESGLIKTGHAGITGGNLDLPFLREGNSIYLPVQVDGAFLYVGDCHSLQSYGELGGIALECSADVKMKVSLCKANSGWYDKDPHIDTQRDTPPLLIAGKEPLTEQNGIGIIGVSEDYNGLTKAVIDANRSGVKFLRQICPRVSFGGARNLLTLIGHSLNGQAGSQTAEPTTMIFFKESDLRRVYRSTTEDTLNEILETVYPTIRGGRQ